MLDDMRLILDKRNLFRYCAKGETAKVSGDVSEIMNLRTAKEIESDRLGEVTMATAYQRLNFGKLD